MLRHANNKYLHIDENMAIYFSMEFFLANINDRVEFCIQIKSHVSWFLPDSKSDGQTS